MNILFKNRYFRRECVCQTWTPTCLVRHLPDKSWCFDYDYGINECLTDFDIIWRLCELGNVKYLKKVKKNMYCKQMKITMRYSCHAFIYKKSAHKLYRIIDIALIVSSVYGHLPIVQYLIMKGANIHIDNDRPLRLSAHKGHLPVVQHLVRNGADIHVEENDTLRFSAYHGCLLVVQYLVEHGADIHAENNFALVYSAKHGHVEVVQYLVEHGANIHVDNEIALKESIDNGHLDVAKYLIERGANKLLLTRIQLEKLNSFAR